MEVVNLFVNKDNISEIFQRCLYKDMDFLCIDIDGNDYYLLKLFLESGFSPSVICVEYNSTYGPDRSITIKYADDFCYSQAHESMLYYGVSVSAWKKFLASHGYTFITCDSRGVNAFFAKTDRFDDEFLSRIDGLAYQENFYELKRFKAPHYERFKLIENMDFVEV